jgi:hypothetical protein
MSGSSGLRRGAPRRRGDGERRRLGIVEDERAAPLARGEGERLDGRGELRRARGRGAHALERVLEDRRMAGFADLHRLDRVDEGAEEGFELVAPAERPHPREPALGEHAQVVAHDEHRPRDAVGDDDAEEPERAGEEERDRRERAEQHAVAPCDERASLRIRREERGRLRVSLVEPEPEHDCDAQPGARHEERVLELEPAVDEDLAPVVRGRRPLGCGGCLGHAMLPLGPRGAGPRAILSFAPRTATTPPHGR